MSADLAAVRDALRQQRARAALALLDAASDRDVRDALFLLDCAARKITTGSDAVLVLHRVAFDSQYYDAGRLLSGVIATLCGGNVATLTVCDGARRAAVVGYPYALLAHRLGVVGHVPAEAARLAADLAAMPVRVDTPESVPAALATVQARRVA